MANNNDKFISRENAKTLWGYMIDLLTGKQNKLTFDDTPTQGSDNPVKSGGIFTALAGKGTYSKPQNGIPKTDLESAVQTSLGKADTALQSFIETDPTVPTWAKANSKPTYNSDEISDDNRTHKFATAAQLEQIETNRKNVLYAMNRGAKNLFNMYKWMDECTVVGGGKSVDSNYTLTLNATSSNCYTEYEGNSYPSDVEIEVQPNEQYVITWGYSRVGGSGRGTVYVVFVGSTGETSTSVSAEVKKIEFTTPAGTYGLRVYIKQTTSGLYEQYAYMMLCSKNVWDTIGHDYMPPSIPNSDLTQLEAEDRAALAEVVDSGAKNLLDIPTTQTVRGLTFTKDSDNWVTTNSASDPTAWTVSNANESFTLKAGTYTMVVYSKAGNTDDIECSVMKPDSTKLVNAIIAPSASEEYIAIDFTLTTSTTVYVMYKVRQQKGRFMLCTKAEFDVSKAFVPYRVPINGVFWAEKYEARSTTLVSTGIKFTASKQTIYRITATAQYGNSKPTQLVIKKKLIPSESEGNFVAVSSDTNSQSLTATGIMTLGVGGYFEVYAAYDGTTSNRVYAIVEEVVL